MTTPWITRNYDSRSNSSASSVTHKSAKSTNHADGVLSIKPLLAYYADDFTGSTDALEALTSGGVETALFVEPPNAESLRRYPHVRAIGVAGNSRAMSPAAMDTALPQAFQSLLDCQPAIVHYKTCSTFDSSPEIGSIGRAIDLGQRVFANRVVPVVVGVPPLQRYCVFGNLFACSGQDSEIYRLDRHPTMQRHPVTPMTEADLRVHLGRQTSRPIRLIDVLALDRGPDACRSALSRLTAEVGSAVLFDTLTSEHLAVIGRVIWELYSREEKPLFVVGSSGVEYALTMHWRDAGLTTNRSITAAETLEPVDRTVIVSGSCSPVTRRQIARALESGFEEVRLDVDILHQSAPLETEFAEIVYRTLSVLDRGASAIVHTFRDLTDSSNSAAGSMAPPDPARCERFGNALGRILLDVLQSAPIRRAAVVGGDTSGYVARTLRIESLEMIAPLARGAPLCAARSREPAVDRLELVFKGGQVGDDDFFSSLLGLRTTCTSAGHVQ